MKIQCYSYDWLNVVNIIDQIVVAIKKNNLFSLSYILEFLVSLVLVTLCETATIIIDSTRERNSLFKQKSIKKSISTHAHSDCSVVFNFNVFYQSEEPFSFVR